MKGIKNILKTELQPGECLFLEFDLNLCDLNEAQSITELFQQSVPEGVIVIGYPSDLVKIKVVKPL